MLAILGQLAATSSGSGGAVSLILTLLVMGGVFYFLLIRPQQRQRRKQADLLSGLELNDEVQTIGGMFGVIREIDDESVLLEVAAGVEIRFTRGAIARKLVFDDEDDYEEEAGRREQHQEEEAGEQK